MTSCQSMFTTSEASPVLIFASHLIPLKKGMSSRKKGESSLRTKLLQFRLSLLFNFQCPSVKAAMRPHFYTEAVGEETRISVLGMVVTSMMFKRRFYLILCKRFVPVKKCRGSIMEAELRFFWERRPKTNMNIMGM